MISEKNILQTPGFRKEKSMQRNSWEKQYPAPKKILLMTYNAEKTLTPLYVGKKISNSPEVWEKTRAIIGQRGSLRTLTGIS